MTKWPPGVQSVLFALSCEHVTGNEWVPTKDIFAIGIVSRATVKDRLKWLERVGILEKRVRRGYEWRIRMPKVDQPPPTALS